MPTLKCLSLCTGYLVRKPDLLGPRKVKNMNMSEKGVREESKRSQRKKRGRVPRRRTRGWGCGKN